MRIIGTSGTGGLAAAPTVRRAATSGFAVNEETSANATAAPAALRTVGGIDALLALQGVEDPTERRRHAVKRGRIALDALDELKIGLLGGGLSPAMLTRLQAAASHLKDTSGEVGLDAVLGEIQLRVEVEIAKLAPR
jgi:hypothetical protein